VISDMYPLFGWHKASYINVVSVLGALAFLALAALPITTTDLAGFLLLLGNVQVCHSVIALWGQTVPAACVSNLYQSKRQIATTDLLMEGQYASKMAAKPQTGPMMVRHRAAYSR
jgi:hypothetical protein